MLKIYGQGNPSAKAAMGGAATAVWERNNYA